MSIIQTIDVGTFPNDGNGDSLRDSQIKANANFVELNATKVEIVGGKALSTNDYTNQDKTVVTNLTYLTGFTPENSSNKQNNMVYDGTGTKFPTVDAVNNQANNFARVAVATGFLDTTDPFKLYVYDDFTLGVSATTYGIAFSTLFKTPTPAPSQGIKQITQRTVPLSNIPGLTGTGNTVRFVGYRESDDSIVFSESSFVQSPTICQLGLVLVKFSGGTTSFIDSIRNVITIPDVAAYSNLETTVLGYQSNVLVNHANGDLRIQNTGGSIKGISANWGNGTNSDERPISASTATTFTLLSPANATQYSATTVTQFIDPTRYWNGSALVAVPAGNNATIQRVLVTLRGNIAVQYGERFYSDFVTAKANVSTETFSNVLPAGTFVEIGRIVMKKSTTNLSDVTTAEFITTGGGSSFGQVNPNIEWGTITGTLAAQTDLNTVLNSKTTQTGTTNTIPKILSSTTLGSSNISDNGSIVTISTDASINGLRVGKGNNSIATNTVLGIGGLSANTNGANVTSVGNNALKSNTTGTDNTAIGSNALLTNSVGNFNSALGSSALRNITGSQNIGIGYDAGRYITDGSTPNSGATNGVYVGISTKALANGGSNEIVIGNNTTGLGSNTVTLGNGSITTTRLRGAVQGGSFVKDSGTSSEFLKADGSVSTLSTLGVVTGSGTTSRIPLWSSSSALTNAVAGTDYSTGTYLLATGMLKTTTGTGALSVSTGTTNTLPKWDATNGLTNSNISDNGTLISLSSNTSIIGSITATTFVKNGGTYNDILIGNGTTNKKVFFNVLDYGVIGNGIADDTAAFNYCIGQANAYNGIVLIPNNVNISVNNSITIPSNTTIQGANKFNSKITLASTGSSTANVIQNASFSTGNTNISLSNFTIDARNLANTTAIQFQKCSGVTISEMVITRGGIEGVYLYLCNDIIVNDLTAYNNGLYQVDASGIHFDTCTSFQLNGCISYSNGFHGVICSSSIDGYIQATVHDNGFNGILCQNGCEDIVIDCNSYDNFRGVYLTDCTRIRTTGTIKGNVNGFLTRDTTKATVSVTCSGNGNDLYLVGGTDEVNWCDGSPIRPSYVKDEATSILYFDGWSGGTSSQYLKADGSVDSTTYTPTTRTISTTSPLQGGGDLSGDRTLSILTATTSVTGVLTSTDWNTFNSKQSALVSGTNIKTVNSTSLLGSGDVAVQATLVSGTNIKTINGNSILGSGNLVITGASGTDVFVTGGTYTAGTATFTNNTGGTFSVTGFSTGATGGGGGSPWMATNAGNPTQSPIAIGTDAIAIGDGAYANDDDMISIGSGAGNGPFLGINCISIGKGAGTNSLIPISSIFIGVDAGRDSYDSGICIGTYAGKNSTSFNSVFIGQSAGESASNAETTIGIGYQAGKFFTGNDIGTNNIIIGTNISLPNATANAINLGGILFGTGAYSTTTGNPSISANTAGRIGIGVVNPVEKLDVSGAVRTTQLKLVALNTAPSSSGDTGTLGEIRWDANYMYVCTAPNTWKRSQLNSW